MMKRISICWLVCAVLAAAILAAAMGSCVAGNRMGQKKENLPLESALSGDDGEQTADRGETASDIPESEKDRTESGDTDESGQTAEASFRVTLPLKEEDLWNLSSKWLRIAKNEIYARHGRKFADQELQAYFNGCSWYEGTIEPDDFTEDRLNEYEKANVLLIQKRQQETE